MISTITKAAAVVSMMIIASAMVDSFVILPSSPPPSKTTSPAVTTLFGRSIKRGNLVKNVSPTGGGISKKTKKGKIKKKVGAGKAVSEASSSSGSAGVSSALSEWAAQGGGGAGTVEESPPSLSISSTPSATEFATFEEDDSDTTDNFSTTTTKKKGGKRGKNVERREKQSARRAEENARQKVITTVVDQIETLLESPNTDLNELLSLIRTLTDKTASQTGSIAGALRNLSISPQSKNYRMVWVGSDEAVCHIGTGLHKVPLARLEEVFLCLEKKTVQVLEVIRILGPFPNVRNTLMGDSSVIKPPGGTGEKGKTKFRIEYNSMIDGTGKEILAGKEDNVKIVDLDVLFADDKVMVCVVPPVEGEEKQDPLGENGSKVLLFFQEDYMNDKLEKLRAA
uniref:Uncharacterized protein n=1 Tax=Helicotheca tamesis TaxID=374047 RepID=A0A7S2I456_9STRA|mmetsp:Transcript_5268/g.7217  ORF Transcript_5268/g.7217 Transcript_5268/m.7217 type:complete len:397 (+) Transcript_5268:198-1388(+)|eukprot:CAMPEP_0185735798 /NCGR_PEP_ID=MMETSP1171-20130828/26245_1 /TAXON_ID=374046 /ORGANISM="Helicotheca tamensis, Strain CCMP826" /LENGTH=396 /DNA_ID=CAMNT_0028406227 /DNA_START=146 /DNA_END=1336 /DNA_ORIENTATION=+